MTGLADFASFLPFIFDHAKRDYPREACGLIASNGERFGYLPCRNIAEGNNHFIAHPQDIARAEDFGQLVAVVHSHPNGQPNPSEADRVGIERWGIPWLIVSWPSAQAALHAPCGYRPPLVGRTFHHGVLDCYALVRDYFDYKLRLKLPDYDRDNEWWLKGGNLYLERFADAGFVEVDPATIREHDVALMELRSPVPNHAGVYLGDNVILHHVMTRLSRREGYAGFWQRITRKVVRHHSLC